MYSKLLQLCLTLCDPYGPYVAHQTPLSMGFSRQEYWSRLMCPPPGDLPDLGIELDVQLSCWSPALAGGFFTTATIWEAQGAGGGGGWGDRDSNIQSTAVPKLLLPPDSPLCFMFLHLGMLSLFCATHSTHYSFDTNILPHSTTKSYILLLMA